MSYSYANISIEGIRYTRPSCRALSQSGRKESTMKGQTSLYCICAGVIGPALLLVGGGFFTSTDAADSLMLFFKSYGIGLLFPGVLFLCSAIYLKTDKGLLPNILWILFAIPGAGSFAAIMLKFSNWLNIFTIGQGIAWSLVLMFGIGLFLRKKITTQSIAPVGAVG